MTLQLLSDFTYLHRGTSPTTTAQGVWRSTECMLHYTSDNTIISIFMGWGSFYLCMGKDAALPQELLLYQKWCLQTGERGQRLLFIVQTTAHICADQYSLADFSKAMSHQTHTSTVPRDHGNTLAKVANHANHSQWGHNMGKHQYARWTMAVRGETRWMPDSWLPLRALCSGISTVEALI